ncbi:hypothetical protein N0V82_008754 [Gnomoniopsis sp. IMI 355080]|nr:hypothetical protein N0V82_008754 [Gnomoniopsis sp. IMI 355080]
MRVDYLLISLFAAVAVHAVPQEDNNVSRRLRATVDSPIIPDVDPSELVEIPPEPLKVGPRNIILPGFCPTDIAQFLGDLLNLGGGDNDCRCGESVGLQAASAETDSQQSLGAAPNWSIGGNDCGCEWEQNQCGCYDGTSGDDGWLLGTFGDGGGDDNNGDRGGDGGENRCTVIVTETAPLPIPVPTNPGNCGSGDRYCTVTVTVSEPGQQPGQPGQPGFPTVPGESFSETFSEGRKTTVTIAESGGRRTTETLSPTLSRTTIPVGGGESRTTSVPTFVTVNGAAAVQTGAMAFGAMFGGAAMLVNA